jgi:hypothetical protein
VYGSLHDVVLKLNRAGHHIDAIERDLAGGLTDPQPRRLSRRTLRGGREYRFYVADAAPDLDVDAWAVEIGDCLFNLRAALDHLVFQLHVRRFRGRVPPPGEHDSAFPIRRRVPRGETNTWREISALAERERVALKQFQPYIRRKDRNRHVRGALAALAELNNTDKHRHIHVARRAVFAHVVPTVFPDDCGFSYQHFYGRPLEPGIEVERWTFEDYVPETGAEQAALHTHLFEQVSVFEPTWGSDLPALDLTKSLFNHVRTVIHRLADRFPPCETPPAYNIGARSASATLATSR